MLEILHGMRFGPGRENKKFTTPQFLSPEEDMLQRGKDNALFDTWLSASDARDFLELRRWIMEEKEVGIFADVADLSRDGRREWIARVEVEANKKIQGVTVAILFDRDWFNTHSVSDPKNLGDFSRVVSSVLRNVHQFNLRGYRLLGKNWAHDMIEQELPRSTFLFERGAIESTYADVTVDKASPRTPHFFHRNPFGKK